MPTSVPIAFRPPTTHAVVLCEHTMNTVRSSLLQAGLAYVMKENAGLGGMWSSLTYRLHTCLCALTPKATRKRELAAMLELLSTLQQTELLEAGDG